jgi:hypothetical protein
VTGLQKATAIDMVEEEDFEDLKFEGGTLEANDDGQDGPHAFCSNYPPFLARFRMNFHLNYSLFSLVCMRFCKCRHRAACFSVSLR